MKIRRVGCPYPAFFRGTTRAGWACKCACSRSVADDLRALHAALRAIEAHCGWPPDVEWTDRTDQLAILQARPITMAPASDSADQRSWYLSLRPNPTRLRDRIVHEFIPALEAEGARFAAEDVCAQSDAALADALAVLKDHVCPGRILASEVVDRDTVRTLSGRYPAITAQGGVVMIEDARIVPTDIECTNGVIDAIDSVLMLQQ